MGKCPIHGRELTLLFTSARCDECDGLIEKPQSEFMLFSPCGGTFTAVMKAGGSWAYRSAEPPDQLAKHLHLIGGIRFYAVEVHTTASVLEFAIEWHSRMVAAINVRPDGLRRKLWRGEYEGKLIK